MSEYIYVTPYKNGKPQRTVLMKKGSSIESMGADYVVPVKKMNVGGSYSQTGEILDFINKDPNNPQGFPGIPPSVFSGAQGYTQGSLEGFKTGDQKFENFIKNYQNPETLPETLPEILPEGTAPDNTADQDLGEKVLSGETQTREPVQKVNSLNQSLEHEKLLPGLEEFKAQNARTVEGAKEKKDYSATEKEPYFNPYQGFDTNQAAFLLGQSIKGDASLGTGIVAGSKVGLSLARNITSGMGLETREEYIKREKEEKDRIATEEQRGMKFKRGGKISYNDILKYRSEGIKLLKDGGEIDFGKRMTGEYIEGLPEGQEDQGVVELEAGEHLLQPDGSMQEVVGDKHSQGGETLSEEDIQEGTIVISDDTKIGGEIAKYFRSKYEIKLTAKNTFADVVDKAESKIGVTKINKELEDLYNKLEKEEKETQHNPTKELNREYISEMINVKEQEKAELEEQRLEIMEDVYKQQEGEKEAEESAEDDIDFEFLKEIAQQTGLDELQATEAVQEFKRGGTYFQLPKMNEGGGVKGEDTIEGLKNFFKEAQRLGYKGKIDFESEDLGAEVKPLQEWMSEKHPEAVIKYFREGTTMTAKGIDMLKESSPKLFSSTGMPIDKPSGQWTEEERKQLYSSIKGTILDNNKFWIEQFKDGRWEFRYPDLLSKIETTEGVDPFEGLEEVMQDVKDLEDFGKIKPAEKIEDLKKEDPNREDSNKEVKEDKRRSMKLPHMPDDWVLPPSSMQPPRKNVTNLGRDEAMFITPEQDIINNQRQVSSAMGAISSLPPEQRAAMMASMQSDAMTADAQAISQANQFNMQADAETRRFNIGQADKESIAAGVNADQYEDKMFKTQAIYDENVRGFLDYMRDTKTTRFKDVRNQNLVGSMHEDFFIDDNGQVVVREDSRTYQSLDRTSLGSGNQKSAEQLRKEEAERKKKSSSATKKKTD